MRRADRPRAQGALDWGQSAEELSALVRGLDYGPYANPLSLPKALLAGIPFIVVTLELLEQSSGSTPGTLLRVSDDGLDVATATRDVRIPRVRTLAGEQLSGREAALRLNLREGDLLRLPEALAASVTAVTQRITPHELWWIRHLAQCEPGTLPFPDRTDAAGVGSLPLDLSSLPLVPGQSQADIALALITGLLARLRGRAQFSVTYEEPELAARVAGLDGWVAAAVPARLQVAFDGSLETLVKDVAGSLAEVRTRQTYATDLPLRQPAIRMSSPSVLAPRRRLWSPPMAAAAGCTTATAG
jgi:hypothetical protein